MVDIGGLLNLQARSRRNALVAARRLHRDRADAMEAATALRMSGSVIPDLRPPPIPKR
jgi:hypothetical protein